MDIKYYSKGNTCADCGKLITDYATWCRSCARRHYGKAEITKARREAKLRKKNKNLKKPDITACKSCIYSCRPGDGNVYCDYITITGHSRMCFNKECDKYINGRLKKIYGKNLTTLKKYTKNTKSYKLISSDDKKIEVIQIGTGIIRQLER